MALCMAAVAAEAQIEHVVTLKEGLKAMLQARGARSLKKKAVVVSGEEAKAIRREYGFEPNRRYVIYTGLDADKEPLGSVVVVDIEGKEGPLQLLVAIERDSASVYDLAFTLFGEERGKPALKKSFLGQFIGFTRANSFELGEDVDAISGATRTSASVTLGVQQAVGIFDYYVWRAKGG